jgi:phage portal protein BeeE
MIGAATRGDTITYANREQRAQDFLNNAVNPWLARLEEALTAWFPRGTYVKFNTGALLKSDLAARYAAHAVGITNGFLLRSEARKLEELPTIAGIDDQPKPVPAPAAPAVPQDPAVGVPKN